MFVSRITINPDELGGQPCIRDLGVKFWDVYRDLSFHGLEDDEVLRKYPALEAEDLDAVREYAVHIIKSRTCPCS